MAVRLFQLVLVKLIRALNVPEALPYVADAARKRGKVKLGFNNGLLGRIGHLVRLTFLPRLLFFDTLGAMLHQVFDELSVPRFVPVGWNARRIRLLAVLQGLLALSRCWDSQRQSPLTTDSCHNLNFKSELLWYG